MDYLPFAVELAKKAGVVMRENFVIGMPRQWKEDKSPVTITDTAINSMVIQEIAKAFPGHGVLGEEESALKLDSEYLWVCDPVDGTIPFSYGWPTCVFALALVHQGQPILSVIYDPFIDRMFAAEKGKGATLNGKPIHVSNQPTLEQSIVGIAGGKGRPFELSTLFDTLRSHGAKAPYVYSTLYLGMLVAAGELVGNIFGGNTLHDAVSLVVLIEEAGGKVTDVYGNFPERWDGPIEGCVVSNGLVHNEIMECIAASPVRTAVI